LPGEVLNVIEIFAFLKENSIIDYDDINSQEKEDFVFINVVICYFKKRGKKLLFGDYY
jgi:hypothetical protein